MSLALVCVLKVSSHFAFHLSLFLWVHRAVVQSLTQVLGSKPIDRCRVRRLTCSSERLAEQHWPLHLASASHAVSRCAQSLSVLFLHGVQCALAQHCGLLEVCRYLQLGSRSSWPPPVLSAVTKDPGSQSAGCRRVRCR